MQKRIPSSFIPVEADYLSPKVKPPFKLFRRDGDNGGNRFYYRYGRSSVFSYISLTSLINEVLPKGPGFYRWVAMKGAEAERIREERAVFGSAIHEQSFFPLKHGKGYDFDWLSQKDGRGISNFQKLFPKEYWDICGGWKYGFTKSLMAFFQFVQEKVTEVIAVEIPLCSNKYGYAGTLDFVGKVMFNGKERLCIMDMKSNFFTLMSGDTKKTFFDTHELQLELQKQLWLENFGGDEDIMLFNWSPNNYREKPTYTFENQTKNQFAARTKIGRKNVYVWELYLALAKAKKLPQPPSKIMEIVGGFESIEKFNWEDHVLTINLT